VIIDGFDWNQGNLTKCQKHGVPVAEIESLFHQDHQIAPDFKHSAVESRHLAVGRSASGRAMFVVFTLREHDGKQLVRPISARYMHAEEIERYEQNRS
jgi:hypothetical protein